MKRIVNIFVMFTLSTFFISTTSAQEKLYATNPFVGTWKLISITNETLPHGDKINSFGLNPSGYLNYSSDGRVLIRSDIINLKEINLYFHCQRSVIQKLES